MAVVILLAVATAGYVFLAPHGASESSTSQFSTPTSSATTSSTSSYSASSTTSSNSESTTSISSTFSAVTSDSSGPMPNASSIEIANITVSQSHAFTAPEYIATDENTSTIYLTGANTNNVTLVNASTYAVVGRITLPADANRIAIDQRTNMVYIGVAACENGTPPIYNQCGGTRTATTDEIAVIDGYNDTIVRVFHIDLQLFSVDSNSGVLWGGCGSCIGSSPEDNDGYLLGVDTKTGDVIANVSLGELANSIAVDEKTNMIYVETCSVTAAGCGHLIAINGSTDDEQFSVPLAYSELGNLVVDPAADTVFALGIIPGVEMLSIDGATGAIRYLSVLARCDIWSGSEKILAFNPALGQVYVISNVFMVAVDAGSGQETYTLSIPGALFGASSPDGGEVFLAMGPANLANVDTGYLLVIPGSANESYVTDFAQLSCHAP